MKVYVLTVDWDECEHGDLSRTSVTVHSSFERAEAVLREHISMVSYECGMSADLEFIENNSGDWFGDLLDYGSQPQISYSVVCRVVDSDGFKGLEVSE